MTKIIPAIIPESLQYLRETLGCVRSFTHSVQIDIVDGKFVPFTSWPYREGEKISDLREFTSEFDIEVDLMIKEPEDKLFAYVDAGVKRVIIHLESTEMPEYILEHHAKHNYLLGFSINNTTPLETLTQYIDDIDFVQLMGIADIGSQGQPFDERVLDRTRELHELYPELFISIDGSVNMETVSRLYEAGANRFVAGSAILKADDPKAAWMELEEQLH